MNLHKKLQMIFVIDFLLCIVYLMRSTYMILGMITIMALAVSLNFTCKMENIIANKIEFVSSFVMGGIIFIIRTLFHISGKGVMIGIMSIVVSFFLMSAYVVVRMILFSILQTVNSKNKSASILDKKQ